MTGNIFFKVLNNNIFLFKQLNSVREALFSQDGWGGSNVKQDSTWDCGSVGGATSSGSGAGPEKPESNTWGTPSGGHRNDGTDLWKSTLSGQPPVPKPQPSNAWTAPANNTDFKQWGVEDEDGASGGGPGGSNVNGAIGPRSNAHGDSVNRGGTYNANGAIGGPRSNHHGDTVNRGGTVHNIQSFQITLHLKLIIFVILGSVLILRSSLL